MCLIRATFALGVKYVGQGWAGDVMAVPYRAPLHGAAFTICLCTWVREECVGGHSTGSYSARTHRLMLLTPL